MGTPTQTQAEKIRRAVVAQSWAWIDAGCPEPVLDMDWDGRPAILWEEGPADWTYLFPGGGIEEEFGIRVRDVSDMIPAGIYVEPVTHYALGIYREDS